MDIKVYNQSLSSIRLSGVHRNDVEYLYGLILYLCNCSETADFNGRRPTVSNNSAELLLLKNQKLRNIEYNEDLLFYFSIDLRNSNVELSKFLSSSWFNYDNFFVFFTKEYQKDINIYRNEDWNVLINKIDSFVIFKSIEDDVLWLAQTPKGNSLNVLQMVNNIING